VLQLSAANAGAELIGNLICGAGAARSAQKLVAATAAGDPQLVRGSDNWFGNGFADPGNTGIAVSRNHFGARVAAPFAAPAAHDYRPNAQFPKRSRGAATLSLPIGGTDGSELEVPLLWQYLHPAAAGRRPQPERPTVGALEP
jgi:hypothetical protein